MQSKSMRIAYLKRMLKRLEGEEARLKELVTTGDLTQEAADLGMDQFKQDRAQLVSEL
jgi:hypothetical protein